MHNGDTDLAIRNYKKTLELDGTDTTAVEMSRKPETPELISRTSLFSQCQ